MAEFTEAAWQYQRNGKNRLWKPLSVSLEGLGFREWELGFKDFASGLNSGDAGKWNLGPR